MPTNVTPMRRLDSAWERYKAASREAANLPSAQRWTAEARAGRALAAARRRYRREDPAGYWNAFDDMLDARAAGLRGL